VVRNRVLRLYYKQQEGFHMAIKTTNQFGTVTVSDTVLTTIAGLAACDCAGIVGMSASTTAEGIAELLKRDSLTKGIKVFTNEDSVRFELHVIIEYGVSMVAAAHNVIEAVKYAVESQTGLKVENVDVLIQGIRV